MKAPIFYRCTWFFVFILFAWQQAAAQPPGCILKSPTVHIDFGRGPEVKDFNAASLSNYNRIYGSCPTDGHYTYTSATYDCFRGDWFTLTQDHTPGDAEGNMLLVNASPSGGVFFSRAVGGLQGGRTYELALWMINVCRLYICCSSLSPNVAFVLSTPGGKRLAAYRIGDLPQRTEPQWRKFAGYFTMPAGETTVVLTMVNSTIGGCGNDFALDDITFRECVPPKPAVVAAPKKKTPVLAKKEPAPKTPIKKTAQPAAPNPSIETTTAKQGSKPVPVAPVATAAPVIKTPVPVPPILRTRANPLIRQIETGTGELQIDLYDNGEIDGDTVSVYHNNELVIARARLTGTPIRLRIKVDGTHPQHELVMVAHNLGTIPPNTSLMIVTAGEKRYQVNIAATDQKNARVVFLWKE